MATSRRKPSACSTGSRAFSKGLDSAWATWSRCRCFWSTTRGRRWISRPSWRATPSSSAAASPICPPGPRSASRRWPIPDFWLRSKSQPSRMPNRESEMFRGFCRHALRGRLCAAVIAASIAAAPASLRAGALTPQQQLAFDIYKELIEIDTTTATGDTKQAAEAMAARLRTAGFAEADAQVLSPAPRKGNLVARLRGTGARKPILLLAHLDVVPARREDWSFDPFKLTERDGYFYARGSSDDKFMAAAFVTNMIRYRQEGYKPDRDIIVALETDEEILDANAVGIQWLLKNHRDLIDADFALNEGGSVGLKDGKPLRNSLQTSEKVSVNYQLTVKNKGGHSAAPVKDNAIYRLAAGLTKLSAFSFPHKFNETTRAYFERIAQFENEQTAADIRAALSDKPDSFGMSFTRLAASPFYNAQLRTTCVATMLEG